MPFIINGQCVENLNFRNSCESLGGVFVRRNCVLDGVATSRNDATVDSCPVEPTEEISCVVRAEDFDVPALNALVDTSYTPLVLTGAFIMFAIGLGVGKILNIIAKVKP